MTVSVDGGAVGDIAGDTGASRSSRATPPDRSPTPPPSGSGLCVECRFGEGGSPGRRRGEVVPSERRRLSVLLSASVTLPPSRVRGPETVVTRLSRKRPPTAPVPYSLTPDVCVCVRVDHCTRTGTSGTTHRLGRTVVRVTSIYASSTDSWPSVDRRSGAGDGSRHLSSRVGCCGNSSRWRGGSYCFSNSSS